MLTAQVRWRDLVEAILFQARENGERGAKREPLYYLQLNHDRHEVPNGGTVRQSGRLQRKTVGKSWGGELYHRDPRCGQKPSTVKLDTLNKSSCQQRSLRNHLNDEQAV